MLASAPRCGMCGAWVLGSASSHQGWALWQAGVPWSELAVPLTRDVVKYLGKHLLEGGGGGRQVLQELVLQRMMVLSFYKS